MSNIGRILALAGMQSGQNIGQGMSSFGQNIGGMLTRLSDINRERVKKEEQERRDKGMLGGTMAIQQMAKAGDLDSESLRAYAGSMQGLGMSNKDIMSRVQSLEETNKAANKQTLQTQFLENLGDDYAAEVAAGVATPRQALERYNKDQGIRARKQLVEDLGLDINPELAGEMTAKDIYDAMEAKKDAAGAKEWTEWASNNEINSSNRQEAINQAVKAHGANAPKVVADLELKQLNIKSEREGKKSVPVLITLDSASVFSDEAFGGKQPQIAVRNLPINEDGTLTKEAEDWLDGHASTALIQDRGFKFSSTGTSSNSSITPVTLGFCTCSCFFNLFRFGDCLLCILCPLA